VLISCSTDKKLYQKNLCQELKSRRNSLGSPSKIILIKSMNWVNPHAQMSFWRKKPSGDWMPEGDVSVVQIGKNGLGFGWDLKSYASHLLAPVKVEGDGKTPLGIFLLGKKFGKNSARYFKQKENFLLLNAGTECIDDVDSPYYNQIVETKEGNVLVEKQWSSSELMFNEPLYRQGLFINYHSNAAARAGSCIFMHLQNPQKIGTAGCVSMEKKLLDKVFDFAKNYEPVELIIVTNKIFEEYQQCLMVE